MMRHQHYLGEMIDKLDELGFISRELGENSAGNLVLLNGAKHYRYRNTAKST